MKQYVARLDLDDDEVEILEADSRAELAEMVIDTVLGWAHELLGTESHRLYRLLETCEMVLSVGSNVQETVEKFMSGAELPIITELWEFHESGQDPRGPG